MAIDKEVLDQLLAGRAPEELFAKDGSPDELKKALSERMLFSGAGRSCREPKRRRRREPAQWLVEEDGADDDKIISMYARGMSVRQIRGHLEELYGIDVSPDLISTITDAVLESVAQWQGRPSTPSIRWSSSTRCG